jgi:uncharacterized protein (DUF1778 family)
VSIAGSAAVVQDDARGSWSVNFRRVCSQDATEDLSGRCPDKYPGSMPHTTEFRRRRFEFRVSEEQDALIRSAASLEGTTVTAFLLNTAMERARTIVRDNQDLTLSRDAYERFLAELDAPAAAVPELAKLFRDNPALPSR